LLAGAVSIAVAAVLLALAPAALGPWILSDQIRRAEYPHAVADIVDYGLREAVLSIDLDGSGPLRPGTIRVRWSPAGLWRAELDLVEVDGLGLRAESGAGTQGDARGPLIPTLPIAELVARDLVVRLPVSGSERDYLLSGRLARLPNGGVELGAEIRGDAETLWLDLDGREGAAGVAELAGEFGLELTDFPLAGTQVSTRTTGTVAFNGTTLRVRPRGLLKVRVEAPDGSYVATATPSGDEPAAFAVDMVEGRTQLTASGRLRVESPSGMLAEVDARRFRAVLGDEEPSFSVEHASARLAGLDVDGLRIAVPELELSLDGSLRAGGAQVGGVVVLDGAPAEGVEVTDGRLAIRGQVRWDGGVLEFFPEGCQDVRAARVAASGGGWGTPVEACVQGAAAGPAVSLGPEGISADLSIRPDMLRLGASAQAGGSDVDVSVPELRLVLDAGLDGTPRSLDAEWAGMSVTFPEQDVALQELSASVQFRPRERTPLVAGARTTGIRAGKEPALSGPVALELRAEDAEGDGPLRLAGKLSGAFPARLAGSFDPTSGRGELRLDGREMSFGPGLASLDATSPWLAGAIQDFEGMAQLRVHMGWGPEGLRPGTGELLLRDVAFVLGPVAVQGLNTVLRARSLTPLVLDPGQAVGIGLMDVGVPLTDGQVLFGYGQEGRIAVQDAVWSWAGGTVRTSPFRISPDEMSADIVLDAQGLELGKLLDLLPVDGVSGTGLMSGRIPVEIRGDAVTVRDGRLAAAGPGALRYRPDDPPAGFDQAGTEMLLQALADFRYDSLVLHLDGTAGGELVAKLGVRGANPDFYDGYPVALNLNVSGALDTILRQGLRTYRIPDAVRERMLEFEAQGE
jgi:hypothetical protein